MNFSKEKQAMTELMEVLNKETTSAQFADLKQKNAQYENEQDEFAKRVTYLKYGFEVRTKSVLENVFPETKKILGEEDWIKLGGEYSYVQGRKFININQIGESFPEYLKTQISNAIILEAANFELTLYYSAISPTGNPLTNDSFSKLTEDSLIQTCPPVKLYSGKLTIEDPTWNLQKKKQTYIVFRYNRGIKAVPVEQNIAKAITLLLQPISMHEITTHNISENQLIKTLQFLMRNNLLEEIKC